MNIQEQIINDASKRLADEIDFTILSDMLVGIGWTKVILFPMTWEESAAIDLWVHKNIKQAHENMGLVWVFENEQDAMWFKLRWLS